MPKIAPAFNIISGAGLIALGLFIPNPAWIVIGSFAIGGFNVAIGLLSWYYTKLFWSTGPVADGPGG